MNQDEQIALLEATIKTSQNLLAEINKAEHSAEEEEPSTIQQALKQVAEHKEKMEKLSNQLKK